MAASAATALAAGSAAYAFTGLRTAEGLRMVRPASLRELRRAIAAILAATTAAASATAASAQAPRQEIRQACTADMRALCSGIMPGGGRIKQCMIEKFDKLSDGCKSALKQARAQPPQQ